MYSEQEAAFIYSCSCLCVIALHYIIMACFRLAYISQYVNGSFKYDYHFMRKSFTSSPTVFLPRVQKLFLCLWLPSTPNKKLREKLQNFVQLEKQKRGGIAIKSEIVNKNNEAKRSKLNMFHRINHCFVLSPLIFVPSLW